RTLLLGRRPGGAGARGGPGKGAADRQHRRADARRPASRGRARRLAAEQDFAGTRRAVSTGPCGHVYFLLRISVPRAGAGSAIATRGSRAAALGPLRSIASNSALKFSVPKPCEPSPLTG